MLTVTMPSRLDDRPSYQGLEELPKMYTPPWTHTRTGSFPFRSPGAGRRH